MLVIPIPKEKRALATNMVMGVGGLLIAIIVLLVIVSTVINSDFYTNQRSGSTTYNETTTWLNKTNGWTASKYTTFRNFDPECSIIYLYNGSSLISSGNYTFNGCFLNITAGNSYNSTTIGYNLSYQITYAGEEETAVRNMNLNMSSGIGNISEKLPTILLIIATIILFGALVLLIKNAKGMMVGGESSL